MKAIVCLLVVCTVLTQYGKCSARVPDYDYNDNNADERKTSMHHSTDTDDSSVLLARFPEYEPFQRKIKERLNNSDVLFRKPELRKRIQNLTNEGLLACKTHSGNSLDRSCIGRLTGRTMQLVAAMEKEIRDVPGQMNYN